MSFLRIALLVVLSLPTVPLAQANPAGTWKAVFVGPIGPRPQIVDYVTFTIEARGTGFTGTAKTEPEWPGMLTVSEITLDDDKFSFVGTGKDGWSVNGQYHCCPRLVATATPLPMEAKRIQLHPDFSGTWTFVPQSPASGQAFQRLWTGDPVTITQDATTVTIEYVSGGRAHMPVKLIYSLDGSERTNIDRNSLPESQARTSRAAWRGVELVLTTITPRVDAAGAPDPVETTEALSLESSSTLSVNMTRHSKVLTDSATARYRRAK